jgi:hypothetical protein
MPSISHHNVIAFVAGICAAVIVMATVPGMSDRVVHPRLVPSSVRPIFSGALLNFSNLVGIVTVSFQSVIDPYLELTI